MTPLANRVDGLVYKAARLTATALIVSKGDATEAIAWLECTGDEVATQIVQRALHDSAKELGDWK